MREVPPGGDVLRAVLFAINQLIRGRSNAVGTVTLTAGATRTTVAWANANAGGYPVLQAMTANAAAALPTTYVLAADITAAGFTITHANAGTTDRTFAFHFLGGG